MGFALFILLGSIVALPHLTSVANMKFLARSLLHFLLLILFGLFNIIIFLLSLKYSYDW
jgi:hypothetical protein